MTVTIRTVEEAKIYIAASLTEWEALNESKKIISLSNWAEKWRPTNAAGYAKIKTLKSSIRYLEGYIKNATKEGETVNPNIAQELKEKKAALAVLEITHPPRIPKKRVSKITPTIDEIAKEVEAMVEPVVEP
jgi:hypothetical protein